MWPIEWYNYRWSLVTLKVFLWCLKPFYLKYLGKYSVYYVQMFTHETESAEACNFNYLFENKDFRVSHIQVSVNEVISWKRCQIESLDLLRTSNKKWYMAIEDRQFRWPWVTFKVIPTASLSFLSNVIFCTAHKISTDIARRAVLFSSGTSCLILGFQSGSHVWRADWYWGVY